MAIIVIRKCAYQDILQVIGKTCLLLNLQDIIQSINSSSRTSRHRELKTLTGILQIKVRKQINITWA
mgnify:FL=1